MRQPRHGILLDEPALGQDTRHKEVLMGLAHQLAAAGRLVIITTHDLTLASRADRLLVLGPQGWIADGPPRELLGDAAVWQQAGLRVPPWVLAPEHAPPGADAAALA
jgi:ABC-type hemin transport system ATPase subunit